MSLSLLSRPRPGGSDEPRPVSPPAARGRRPWWRDARVLAGVGIVIGCMLIGARMLASDGDTVRVWQVSRDIAAGTVIGPDDVSAVDVPRTAAAAYAVASGLPTARLARDVTAGELLPAAIDAPTPDVRWVTVPVEPLHAPVDLAPGERVDVYASEGGDLGVPAKPRLVLADALVSTVAADSVGLGGEFGVVLEVTPDATAELLSAVRSGALDLVRVPVGQVP
ncbi:MAG: SAF domain-containing protein [Candidatus Nanopelagicales bacterium]